MREHLQEQLNTLLQNLQDQINRINEHTAPVLRSGLTKARGPVGPEVL